MPEHGLDRSLAFTALMELHPTFADMELEQSTPLITKLTAHIVQARDERGHMDTWEAAKEWIQDLLIREESGVIEEPDPFDPDATLVDIRDAIEYWDDMRASADDHVDKDNKEDAEKDYQHAARIAEVVADLVQRLDRWIAGGGNLPEAWRSHSEVSDEEVSRVANSLSEPQKRLLWKAYRQSDGTFRIDPQAGPSKTRRALRSRGIFRPTDDAVLSDLGVRVHRMIWRGER